MLKEKELELDSVLRALNDLISQINKTDKPAETTSQQVTSSPVISKAPVKTTAPQWACAYCKGMNKAKDVKCSGCGAPKTAPKKKK